VRPSSSTFAQSSPARSVCGSHSSRITARSPDSRCGARAHRPDARRRLRARLQPFVYQGIDQREVDRLLPHTYHLHVRQAAPGVVQARTREGTLDFVRIRDALLALDYAGWFALEYQWEDGWLDLSRVDCVAETRDVLLTTTDGG
jgi:hypothetical protein